MLVRTLSYHFETYEYFDEIFTLCDKLSHHILTISYHRSTKCEYLDGSCLASPRWVSLLVAEIYYPDVSFPNPAPSQNRNPVKGASPPNVCSLIHFYFLLFYTISSQGIK